MITVSDAWKALHLGLLLPESYVEVSYYITEPGLVDDVTSSATQGAAFSQASQIKDFSLRSEPLFASFENNAWVLNGRYSFIPSLTPFAGDVGYVSAAVSLANLTFTTNPILTLQLGSVHDIAIPGITITFAPDRNEWATDIIIRTYNGASLLTTDTITGNMEPVLVLDIAGITDYDKVTVEIVKWSLPDRRARVMEITLGSKQVYTKADLLGYEHTSSGNLSSAELPKNSIMFKLDNTDGRWNPSNPSGLERYLIERQTISVRYGFEINGSIEWIRVGTFFLSEWNTPSNGLAATFTARDSLEIMGDNYNGTRSGTLMAIATAALAQAEISPSLYSLSSSLSAITVNFTADTAAYTISDVLQMCAHAAKCVIHQRANGVIAIAPLNTVASDYAITQFNSWTFPEYTLSKELKSVSVNNNLGTAANSATGEILTSDNPLIQSAAVANPVATWLRNIYAGRKVLKGSFRPDPRAEVYDKITVTSKYATDTIYITQIKYTFGGAFRAEYEGRVMT